LRRLAEWTGVADCSFVWTSHLLVQAFAVRRIGYGIATLWLNDTSYSKSVWTRE